MRKSAEVDEEAIKNGCGSETRAQLSGDCDNDISRDARGRGLALDQGAGITPRVACVGRGEVEGKSEHKIGGGVDVRWHEEVHKQGVALGRSIDLTKFDGYDQLIEELDQLFEFKGELMAPNKNWMIVFTDNEDDMMLVGDDPWQEFCAMVRQIFIYTKEEVQKMNSSLVKILKKYDKRTGALIRQPFIEKVLQQPFFTTDLLYKLVKECVAMLDHLFPSNNLSISAECDGQNGVPKPTQSGGRVPELEEIKYMQSLYMKSTVAALRSLKQIRSKSSTVKTD
ncbi:hypothetical protein ZIOFF_013729 [Zingiber officinale]|uniref:Auxin-responsive protein n=1 Tax=Zingiber officinale TaxID=94328 RepID=A0A8J5HGE8_ZINOF|nr:hypothetical protein ZIOFF_013729 [Zingiber officinale]